jgi:hypothetical protein
MSQSKLEVEVCADGSKRWYLNGKLHREDGPAVEYSNVEKYWYLNGQLHREDGPAIENVNGEKHWCLNGKKVSWQEVFKKAKTQEQEVRVLCYVSI